MVHYRLAELETEVEALRSLHYRAIGEGDDIIREMVLAGSLVE